MHTLSHTSCPLTKELFTIYDSFVFVLHVETLTACDTHFLDSWRFSDCFALTSHGLILFSYLQVTKKQSYLTTEQKKGR